MNTNLTEVVFLLDRSGSMGGLESDTIGGFNAFIEKQHEAGETLITAVLFDDRYEILWNGIDAAKVKLPSCLAFLRSQTINCSSETQLSAAPDNIHNFRLSTMRDF